MSWSETRIMKEAEIDAWLKSAEDMGLLTSQGLAADGLSSIPGADTLLFRESVRQTGRWTLAMLKFGARRVLGIFGADAAGLGFEGTVRKLSSGKGRGVIFAPLGHRNAESLRKLLPYTAPSPLADKDLTFSLGDRLGMAGVGHIRAIKGFEAAPVLAQQSVRELDLTGRSYEDVLDSSTWAVFQEGYERPWGADGDHLKTEDWVRKALKTGFTMITADVSDYIMGEYTLKPAKEVMEDYRNLEESYRKQIEEKFLSLRIELDTGEAIDFSIEDLSRVALIYKEAVEHAGRLYTAGIEERGKGGFDFELSIDETETPTTPQAHAFIALELQRASVEVSSLAPRFVGEFQKGIDYIGDSAAFERSFRTHAALARKFGYRISIHSGSDKFTVFPIVGRLTEGRFHIKTAGTSWLEAVKVIARLEPALYRELHSQALRSFDRAARYYQVTTDLKKVPDPAGLSDQELPGLFENPDARQLIHISYGELLKEPALSKRFFQALEEHIQEYWLALQQHIGRHLKALGVKEGG
ncbi:hypothetical protein ES703_51049 [subsurface metagenome]